MPVYADLINFAQAAKGLDSRNKLKLILFAAGVKPNAHVVLRIDAKNLDEKHHFEKHLLDASILFQVSRAKGYEEISAVRKNKVVWTQAGIWFGYDLFRDLGSLAKFRQYVKLIGKQKHEKADAIGAGLYGYPACCTREYTKGHDVAYIQEHHSYHDYYAKLFEADRKFPFVFHYVCSQHCAATSRLNALYKRVVKRFARKFFNRYTEKKSYNATLIVDAESDVLDSKGKTIWPVRSAHDYSLITQKPLDAHYYLLNHFTHWSLQRGTVLDAKVTIQYDYADVALGDVVDVLPEPVHQRKFLMMGRGY